MGSRMFITFNSNLQSSCNMSLNFDTCTCILFISALHKAGKHMENSIVAAYVALLVGCLIQENEVS